MDAIKVKNLTKNFNGVIAVDNISFSIPVGELFGLLGPNGAGKTATINMFATLLKPASGRGEVVGHDIKRDRDRVRRSIGIVFQEPALDTKLTGRENLEFHAMMYGMGRVERRERIEEVLQLIELTEKEKVLVENFSGGMKRRLEIARGLIHKPQVLFLDEPTSVTFLGLGLIFASKMRDMQGFSIVMNFVIFPLFFLSGALYPLENFPAWLRVLSSIDPLTYGIDGLRTIMIGQSSYPLLFDLGIMVVFSLITIFLGAYFFEKSESI